MSLSKRELKTRIIIGKRKRYIEQKMIPQGWLFKKINDVMLWIEKVLRNKKYDK